MVKVGFLVSPYDQNPPRLIEVEDGKDIEQEVKRYLVSPHLLFKYWIEPEDTEPSIVKNKIYR